MKNYKKIFVFIFTLIIYWPIITQAQVSINQDNSDPDPSAMLDVQSNDKGVLISRMTSLERTSINNPASGLLVYDTDTDSFWYFENNIWIEIIAGNIDITETLDYSISPDFSCLHEQKLIPAGFVIITETLSSEDYIYILDDELYIFEKTDPSNPVFVGVTNQPPLFYTSFRSPAVQNDLFFMVDAFGDYLRVVDISDPSNPVLKDSILVGPTTTSIAIKNNYAYLTDLGAGNIYIIDFSDVNNLALAAIFPYGPNPQNLIIQGDYAYLLDPTIDHLRILNLSNPLTPTEEVSFHLGVDPKRLIVEGEWAYVLETTNDELLVIDITNPGLPSIIGNTYVGHNPTSFDVEKNFAYIGSTSSTDSLLRIVDLRNPSNPSIIDSIVVEEHILDKVRGVTVSGNYANLVMETDSLGASIKTLQIACNTNASLSIDLFSGEISTTNNQLLSLDGTNLSISEGNVVDLAFLGPALDQQTLTYFNNQLSISNGNSVNIPAGMDNLGNHIMTQNLEISGNWLSGDGDNEGLQIDASGNVGIGVNTPHHQLDFGTTLGRKLALYQNTGGSSFYGFGISGGTFELYAAAGVAAEPKMVVKGYTGNIGIGTINPDRTLHVQSDAGNTRFQAKTAGISSFTDWLNHDGSVRGIVGVDGTSYSGNANEFAISTWTPHPIVFRTTPSSGGGGGQERMRITSDGKVEIAGSIKIAGGSPGAGKVLTSDASGNASWQNTGSAVSVHKAPIEINHDGTDTWRDLTSPQTMSVNNGDLIVFQGQVGVRLDVGSGEDSFEVRVRATGSGCSNFYTNSITHTPDNEPTAHSYWIQIPYLDTWTSNCNGTITLRLQVRNTGDDTWRSDDAILIVRKN